MAWGVIAAIGAGLLSNAIASNSARSASNKAASAQEKATAAATEVERERLAQESAQYREQADEYTRRQALNERQMQQTIVNLAPYMQAGQGALYEMMALTGMAAPQGAQMPAAPEMPPPRQGFGGGTLSAMPRQPGTYLAEQQVPNPAFGTSAITVKPNELGGFSEFTTNTASPTLTQYTEQSLLSSPAAQEFQKGGRSLSSSAWENVPAEASDRAAAAAMLRQVQSEMPNASPEQQRAEAIARLNQQYAMGQEADRQAQLREAGAAAVPEVTPAESPYAGMTGAEAQQAAINRIAESPLLQELMAQGETGILQNAAATGGLRGGRVQGVLSQYRPQMLQQEIDKQFARLQGISGMGQQSILGAPTSGTTTMPNMSYQSQIPGLLTEAGAARAGGILAGGKAQQDFYNKLGETIGWGLEKYGGWGGYGGGIGGANATTPTSSGNMALDYGY